MKWILVLVGVVLLGASVAGAQDWNSSPLNWKNNSYNWENSSLNWKNSPVNYDNSPVKYGNERIIRDTTGEATGYAVPKSDGGANFYDLQGHRRGYLPPEE